MRTSALWLIVWFLAKEALSSTPGSATSPVRHWDRSWTASCAQGTAIAMTFQDCVIVFLRSPSTNVWKPPLTPAVSETTTKDISGLAVIPVDSYQQVHFAPSWLSVSENSMCVMTGLASDVEHLGRILQQQGDSHYNVYGKSLTTHGLTQRLSRVLQQAAWSQGGRPFGVQTLLVGGDDISPTRKFGVYSLDPSGSWQSWGGGTTSIGKYAKQVREELAKQRSSMAAPDTLNEALEHIIACWIETCKRENVNLQSKEDYQVLILQKESSSPDATCRLYMVQEDNVRDMVEKASTTTMVK